MVVLSELRWIPPRQGSPDAASAEDCGSEARPIPEGEEDGWTYDPETGFMTFHGGAVPPRGSAVTVN